MDDPEIKAMTTIAKALDDLEDEQRGNVLLYINTRYGSSMPRQRHRGGDGRMYGGDGGQSDYAPDEFDNIGEFFDAANPTTEADRVLVVGYWIQVIDGEEDFESAAVNKHLKNLGHTVSNITRAFDQAMGKTPRLVIQTSKSGSSKQARKKYKVTREGIKRVKKMLTQGGVEDDAE